MNTETTLGGGYWTCSKCGQLMRGSSIVHDCRPIKERAEEFFGKVLKSKNNFEKWIPVEGEITDKDRVMFKIDGVWTEPCSFDSYPGEQIEEVKQAKLFICTNDIQVGDKVNVEEDGYDYGTVIRFEKVNDCEIVWIKTNEGKEEDWVKSSVYKINK